MTIPYPIITKPDRISEFEFQAELWVRLKQLGMDVRGEVPAKHKGRRSVFDLVVFWGQDAALIIEVKNTRHEKLVNGKRTLQRSKYEEYDIPVIYFTTMIPMDKVVQKVQHTIKSLQS